MATDSQTSEPYQFPLGLSITRFLTRKLGGTTFYVVLLSALVGVGGGYGAIFFRWLIEQVQILAFGGDIGVAVLAELPWYQLALPLVVGGLVVGALVHYFAPEARGHGVPEVMDAVARNGGRIRHRVAAVKTLASAVSIGVGSAVGREGPIVQIGSSLGSTLGQVLHLDRRNIQVLVASGAAAGIAATFNAPIAGAMFALEVIMGIGTIPLFTPLVVASVLATAISRYHLGDTPAFSIPAYGLESMGELGLFVLLGCLSALVGVGYSRGLYWMEDLWARQPVHPILKAGLGGLALSLLALAVPQVMGVGYETIEAVLRGQADSTILLLLLLMAAKVFATHISLSAGFSGGVFAPSLFIGATLGGAFGMSASSIFGASAVGTSGAYALVGVSAVVAAATHAPLTVILMAVEMTGDYGLILPLMLSTFIASGISLRVCPDSIYTLKLARRGVRVHSLAQDDVMTGTAVEQIMDSARLTISPSASFLHIVERLLGAGRAPLYVVSDEHVLQGVVHLEDVSNLMRDEEDVQGLLIAADIMRPCPAHVRTSTSLAQAMRRLGHHPMAELPVLDEQHRLVGVLTQRGILAHYDAEVLRHQAAQLNFAGRDQAQGTPTTLDIPRDEVVADVLVAHSLAGRTLRELDLRARYGVQVLGVRHDNGTKARSGVPDPAEALLAGDVLLVSGSEEGVDAVRGLGIDPLGSV